MREGPVPVPAPPGAPGLGAVDNVLLQGLRERGLNPQPQGEREWQTGVPGLSLKLGETVAMKVAMKSGEDLWFGHAEVLASVEHPTFGKHLIQDLVSLDGASADAILTECIQVYLHLTFDPIRALFDETLFASPARRLISVVDPGEATSWSLYTGWLDVRGPDHSVLVECLGERSMLGLVSSTLTGYLAEPKLHWFKLYGESHGAKRQFGCIFDGRAEGNGEREMEAVLNLPPDSGWWSYRGFAVLVPHGEPDAVEVEELRAQLGPPPAKGLSWWPFGGPKRRIIWRTV